MVKERETIHLTEHDHSGANLMVMVRCGFAISANINVGRLLKDTGSQIKFYKNLSGKKG